jgi:hypothetical protein
MYLELVNAGSGTNRRRRAFAASAGWFRRQE